MASRFAAQFGFALPQIFVGEDPNLARVRRVAQRAEQLGFTSLWTQDQLIGRTPVLEALDLLAYVSALTSRARLGVSVLVLGQRNPIELAKRLAGLDQLSGGRLIAGVGLGSRGHAERLGLPADQRIARFNEAVTLMRALWSGESVPESVRLLPRQDLSISPRPRQPRLPLWFGGHHPDALRRAARLADGWMGAGSSSIDDFRQQAGLLSAFLAEAGREPSAFPIAKRLYIALDDDTSRAEARLRRWFAALYGSDANALRVSVYGPAARCAERIAELVEAGASMVLLNPVYDEDEQLTALADLVDLGAAPQPPA